MEADKGTSLEIRMGTHIIMYMLLYRVEIQPIHGVMPNMFQIVNI